MSNNASTSWDECLKRVGDCCNWYIDVGSDVRCTVRRTHIAWKGCGGLSSPEHPEVGRPQCQCLMSAGLILVHALACSNGSVEDDILHTYGRLVEKVGGGWSAVEFWNIHAPSHGVLPWHHGFGSSGVRFLLAIAPPIYCLWPTNYGQ